MPRSERPPPCPCDNAAPSAPGASCERAGCGHGEAKYRRNAQGAQDAARDPTLGQGAGSSSQKLYADEA